MLSRDVCMACTRGMPVPDESVGALAGVWSQKFWVCPALNGFIAIEQDPPKGCLRLMEQGVAAVGVKNA